MQPGRATVQGTARYARRLAAKVARGYFREGLAGLSLSSVGLGTYLGAADAATDRAYTSAIYAAARLGCNVLDTASNYRNQQSERTIGAALAGLASAGIEREEVLVCTKGGFIPLDPAVSLDPEVYCEQALFAPGIARPAEVVAGSHLMTPAFLRHQVAQSLRNLRLETVDVYYLHNPETQREAVGAEEFRSRLRAAFATLEELAGAGAIAVYGMATWDGLRVPPDHPRYLSLLEAATLAEEAAGGGSHFGALQLPFNLAMTEALTLANQEMDGERMSVLDAADRLQLAVFGSAALLQGELLGRLPGELRAGFPQLHTDAQRALQFARSVPGIQAALVGMKQTAHVEENLAVADVPPLDAEQFNALFGGPDGEQQRPPPVPEGNGREPGPT
jgi:aryl-alcohol dehydrogenase-like predicted oxidoreductase